jgi:hypothetical protein
MSWIHGRSLFTDSFRLVKRGHPPQQKVNSTKKIHFLPGVKSTREAFKGWIGKAPDIFRFSNSSRMFQVLVLDPYEEQSLELVTSTKLRRQRSNSSTTVKARMTGINYSYALASRKVCFQTG